MKQIVIGFLIGLLFITGCGQALPAAQTAPIATRDVIAATGSSIPTATQTFHPSATPTASITPLPTIPTFTPTFDASTIVTVTPAPKAECPTIDPTVMIQDYFPKKIEYPSPDTTEVIVEFLNKGGNGETLVKRLDEIYPKGNYRGGYAFRDVTGDQVPEFLYVELNYEGKPIIFSCKNKRFELLAILSGEHDFWDYALQIDDLITDGIPEIIVTGTDGASFPQSQIYIFEWNGQMFPILGTTGISALWETEILDLDRNGTKEVVLIGGNPVCTSCSNFIPQRQRTVTFGWNGNGYAEISNEFTPPKYRFQAIQDADAAVSFGKYVRASQLYGAAISNEELEWWSPERLTYEQHIANPVYMFVETPSASPTEDQTEYPRLAAYAYYRAILLHTVLGNELHAETTYKTLQEKFGHDQYARSYVEMATAFWDSYQSTHIMYDGCAAAIQYAVEHQEILAPLGSDYHGWQSHIYEPADVCPFR